MTRVEAIISHNDTTILHDLFEAAHALQTAETADFAQHRLSEEVWYRNGDTIDPVAEDGSRLSALLGISRIAYDFCKPDLERYSYLAKVREAYEQADRLRSSEHALINSL